MKDRLLAGGLGVQTALLQHLQIRTKSYQMHKQNDRIMTHLGHPSDLYALSSCISPTANYYRRERRSTFRGGCFTSVSGNLHAPQLAHGRLCAHVHSSGTRLEECSHRWLWRGRAHRALSEKASTLVWSRARRDDAWSQLA